MTACPSLRVLWAALPPLLAACAGGAPPPAADLPSPTGAAGAAVVERGEYIVRNVAVCGHCHAEDVRDPDGPLSGGYVFTGWRLGEIPAPNLTPDRETGLGAWTGAEIVRAIRLGADDEGDVLAPVMPWAWFSGMSDEDAAAVAAYLRTLEPVRNPTDRDPNLVLDVAEALFLGPGDRPEGPRAEPPRGATVEYGRYLALGIGLCADCHTPREGIRARTDMDRLFAGQSDPPESFPARPDNLTPDSATGIGAWSEKDFLRTIRTGVNPEGDSLDSFMAWRQYRRMADDDLRAIYRYLRTVPPIRNEVPEG